MIQVVHRAIDILEFIRKTPGKAAGLADIADGLKLNRATCANILRTLAQRDLLEQNERREYCFGPLMYQLTDGTFYDTDLVEASKYVMEELSGQLNESTILTIIHKTSELPFMKSKAIKSSMLKTGGQKKYMKQLPDGLCYHFYPRSS